MKQVLIRKGQPIVAEVPSPEALPGFLLIRVRASCVSPGTEMAGITSSGKSLFRRALEQPDKAKAAFALMRKQGFSKVWKAAKTKFGRDLLAGYSASGVVMDLGDDCEGFVRGQRVAVAGAGFANHAEIVAVPVNLCMAIPKSVNDVDASSVALGGIAMQAVRRAEVSLGEQVVVIGCGPLGLLALQMLRASGCRVLATDLDARRLALARELGAELALDPREEDAVDKVKHWSGGRGADAVILFTATASSEPVSQAFQMCRRKGRVILAGVAGEEYKRDDMYAKELDFKISTSYGPGRYDDDYEIRGRDYPYAYVRWTEKRNMEAYLSLLVEGRVKVAPLIEILEEIGSADAAYEKLRSPERPLLAVLEYPETEEAAGETGSLSSERVARAAWPGKALGDKLGLALIGGGAFVTGTHVPLLLQLSDEIKVSWALSRTGPSARSCSALIPGCKATTDYQAVLDDPQVHAVLIGTRHDKHASLAVQALEAGKAVFVEKPMALTPGDFEKLKEAVGSTEAPYMVGYNRRHSPFARRIRTVIANRVNPLMIHYTMNAGYLPPEHWTQGPEGGGRLMGEACHIVDLFRSLVGCPVRALHCSPLRSGSPAAKSNDNFVLTLEYMDGSVATLLYTAQGNSELSKERMEIYFDEKIIVLDDYTTLKGHGIKGLDEDLKSPDKGHAAEWKAFCETTRAGGRFPIPWEELEETWWVTWQANEVAVKGELLL